MDAWRYSNYLTNYVSAWVFAAQDCLNARTSVVDPVKHSGVCRLDLLSSHTRKALRLRMSVVRSSIVEVWSE